MTKRKPQSTKTTKTLPDGREVHFAHRDTMRTRSHRARAKLPPKVPATPLPVDCTGGAAVSAPMDGNDADGDCMVATAAHVDNFWTYGRGQTGFIESVFSRQALVNQYLEASGGDNGLDEPTLLHDVWAPGIGGNKAATYDDSLDVDVNDLALARFCIDRFFHVAMMWSVPDVFIQEFKAGGEWLYAEQPNPENGHGTPLADIDEHGNYRLWTWGAWVWVSPEFVASVDPSCWVTFSRRQFNAAGYDAHGRHVQDVARDWISIGGSADKAARVAAMFPGPAPGPGPSPNPAPKPAPSSTALTLEQTKAILRAGWPRSQRTVMAALSLAETERLLSRGWPK
jgi:hypothetical protein